MLVQEKGPKRMYRIVLYFRFTLSYSVFVKAHSREEAERIALKKHPDAMGIDRSPFPQN